MTTSSTVTIADLLAHAAWARRLARRLTADEATADDLVQEAWIAAARHPPAGDRPLRPWLKAVLHNLSIKRFRGERRRLVRDAQVDASSEGQAPDVLLERVEAQRLLAELVAGLEEPYRQTLLLRYFEDLSAAEVARRLGVPAGTVRWRTKTALDELKRRLDERHAGQRRRWLGALTPLAPPRPRPWPWPAIGVVAVSAAAVLIFVLAPGRSVAPGAETARALGPPSVAEATPELAVPSGGGAPAGRPAVLAASAASALATCQGEVRHLREAAAAAEAARRKTLPGRELFAMGAANPTAERALAPPIERLLAAAHLEQMSHTLECHTFACRLLIAPTEDEQGKLNAWQLPLQRDEEMRDRTAGMGFHSGNPSKDQLSGVGLTQQEVFLTLAEPSGKRVPQPRPAPAPVVSDAPLPTTAETCAAERRALRAHIQAAQADTDAHQSPTERFAKGPADPKLADELRRHIVDKFGADATAGLEVECRNLVCRNHWPNAPRDWANLHREPWFRKMVDGMMIGGDVYMMMAAGPRADSMGFLLELVKAFDASSAPDDCAARFPATGTLRVKFHLPKTGEPNDDGETGRISAVYGDTLAGTPLGNCMQETIARTILAAPLPTLPVGGAVHYRRFEFPRPAQVRGSTR